MLVAILDKAIQSHSRDRYATARERLNALFASAATVSPTAPYVHPHFYIHLLAWYTKAFINS